MSKLEDGMIRQQVLLEGLKGSEVKNVEREITTLFDTYVKRFQALEPDEFSGLSRSRVNALLSELRQKAIALYARYTLAFTDFLSKFVSVETTMTAISIKNTALGMIRNPALSVFDKSLRDKLWASIQSQIMPSDGVNLIQYIDNLGSSIITAIENSIKQAVANLQSFGQWYDTIKGKVSKVAKTTGRLGGLYNQFINKGRAMVETTIQHVSAQTHRTVQSRFFNQYYWVSVMDGNTSDICRSRNGKLYTYGSGPVPPAHTRCRSKIVPADGDKPTSPRNFVSWLTAQTDKFINKVLSREDADSLRAGTLKAEDLGRFKPDKNFDLNQYKNSLQLIIE